MITEIPYKDSTQFVIQATEYFEAGLKGDEKRSLGFKPVLVKTVGKATENILDMENKEKNESQFFYYMFNTNNPTSICYVVNRELSMESPMYRTAERALAGSGYYHD